LAVFAGNHLPACLPGVPYLNVTNEESIPSPIDLANADAKLRAWKNKYDTPENVAAIHYKTILKHTELLGGGVA
jgi:hypothetical protein